MNKGKGFEKNIKNKEGCLERTKISTTEKILRSIEKSSGSFIGVFGLYADEEISKAIKKTNKCILNSSCSGNNVYETFAASMLLLLKQYKFEKPYEFELRTEIFRRLELITVYSNYSINYKPNRSPLGHISMLGNKTCIVKLCDELIELTQKIIKKENIKFIWRLKIDSTEFNYDFLQNLSKIKNDDLIIIISCNDPLDYVIKEIALTRGNAFANEVLDRYFWKDCIIRADTESEKEEVYGG